MDTMKEVESMTNEQYFDALRKAKLEMLIEIELELKAGKKIEEIIEAKKEVLAAADQSTSKH